MSEEEHLEKFLEKTIPKHLWDVYQQLIDGMRVAFHEGIKFERSKYQRKPGAVCPNCGQQGISGYDQSNKRCPKCGESIFLESRKK